MGNSVHSPIFHHTMNLRTVYVSLSVYEETVICLGKA